MPNDSVRDLPDVSLLAGDGTYGALWAVCDNSSDGNGGTLDCVAATNGTFENDAVGGTSTSTPAWASILALARQKTGDRLGQALTTLYSLFNGSSSASIFHDVTTGNNSVPCAPSATTSASCVMNTAGFDFEGGYDTNTGYDLATGLGSVDVTALVTSWSSTSTPITPTLTLTPSATSIAANEALTVAVTVAGPSGSATPTGTVTLTVGTYTSSPATLASGAASITVPASTLTPGSYTVQVGYTPDAASSSVYFAGSGSTSITVGGFFTIGPATSTVAVTAGATTGNTTTITITPADGYTGTVGFTCTLTTPAAGSNPSYYPACTVPNVTIASGATSGTATAAFSTTARSTTTSSLDPRTRSGTIAGIRRPEARPLPVCCSLAFRQDGAAGSRCLACWFSW